MAIPFNVPSEEQPESEWVVQFQMIFKRNILNLLNEMASIRDNRATYPDRLPDSLPPPMDPTASDDGASLVPSTSAAPDGQRTEPDGSQPSRSSGVGVGGTSRNANMNLHILLSSALNARNGTLAANLSHADSARRSRRQRSSSESSCCEEAKNGAFLIDNADDPVEPAQRDFTQVGAFLRQIADDFKAISLKEEEVVPSRHSKERCKENTSLFSKLMPASIKNSIWTAVICVIGWHLFRAR